MILALLAMLAGTCITGYMMTTDAFWGAIWLRIYMRSWPI